MGITLFKPATVYRDVVCRQLHKHPIALHSGASPGLARNSNAKSRQSTNVIQFMVSLANE